MAITLYSTVWSVRNRAPGIARLDFLFGLRNQAVARLDFLIPLRNWPKFSSPSRGRGRSEQRRPNWREGIDGRHRADDEVCEQGARRARGMQALGRQPRAHGVVAAP